MSKHCEFCSRFFILPTGKRGPKQRWCSAQCRQRQWWYKQEYGIEPKEALDLWDKQGGVCKLCGIPLEYVNRRTHLDHCHSTGRIRGFLCQDCNHGVGHVERLEPLGVLTYLGG